MQLNQLEILSYVTIIHMRLLSSIHTLDRILATYSIVTYIASYYSYSILQKLNKQDMSKNFEFEKGSRNCNKK